MLTRHVRSPVSKQMMLYDIGTTPGKRLPHGNMEPLNKPPTAPSVTGGGKQPGSKPATAASKHSQVRENHIITTCIIYDLKKGKLY